MIKSLSYRITAISMALLLLLSTTGFSMDVHYCQDQLKGVSFIGKAKSCHEKQAIPACHHKKQENQSQEAFKIKKDNCCHNESIVLEKSDVDATNPVSLALEDLNLEFAMAFVAIYVIEHKTSSERTTIVQYKPPLPDSDRQVVYQSFLI